MAKKTDKWIQNYAKNKQLCERVLAVFLPKVKSVRNDREPLERDWMRFYNMWNVEHDEGHLYSGNSKLYIPEVRKAIEAQARQLTDLAFPSNEFFGCAPGASGTNKGAEIQKAIRAWQIQEANLLGDYLVFNRQKCMYGTSIAHVAWDKRTEMAFASARNPKTGKIVPSKKLIELYNGPTFNTVDLFKWYPLNNKKRNHNDDGCFHVRPVDREFIDKADKMGMIADKEPIFEGMSDASKQEEFEKDIERAETLGLSIESDQGYAGTASLDEEDQNKLGTYKLTCIYAKVVCPEACLEGEDPDKPIPMMIHIYNDTVVACIKRNPFWHQKTPYLVGRYIYPNPDEFYGQGIAKATQYQQYELNSKAEQSMDSVTMALNPLAIIDPAYASQNADFEIEPAAIWWADPAKVRLTQMPDVSGTGYQAVSQMRSQIQDFSDRAPSLPSQFQGKSRTATQSDIIDRAMTVDFKTFQRQDEADVLVPMLEMWESLTDQFADDDQMIMITGRNYDDWRRMVVSREMYLGNYKYFWKVSSDFGNKAIKARQMIDAMKVAGSLPPEAQAKLGFDYAEAYRILFKDMMMLPNSEEIIPDPNSEPKQNPPSVYRMLKLGMEVECLPTDDDKAFIQYFGMKAKEEQDEGVKRELIRQIMLHDQQLQKKVALMKQQIAERQQQMAMMAMQAQAGKKPADGGGMVGSGNRTQLSPNATPGAMASGIKP